MKKLILILLFISLYLFDALGRQFSYENINYTILSEEAGTCITSPGNPEKGDHGLHKVTGDIVIPMYAEYEGREYLVVGIGDYSFYRPDNRYDSMKATSVELPPSLVYIGSHAFENCTLWAGELVLPSSVLYIGSYAFRNCESLEGELVLPPVLENVEEKTFENCKGLSGTTAIPSGVTNIGAKAFYGCELMEAFLLPAGISYIGEDVFSACSSLEAIDIAKGNSSAAYSSFDGVLYKGKYYVELIKCPEGKATVEFPPYDLPYKFSPAAFRDCRKLTEVAVPLGVGYIPDYCFEGCISLTDVTLPEWTMKFGQGCFKDCRSLRNLALPEGTEEIAWEMFEGCESLEGITIPDGLAKIGFNAFRGCSSLQELEIPESVTEIASGAFTECASLRKVTWPRAVKIIEDSVFEGCRSLDFEIPEWIEYIFNYSFRYSNMPEVRLSDKGLGIGMEAFRDAGVKKVKLGENVRSIGDCAFMGNDIDVIECHSPIPPKIWYDGDGMAHPSEYVPLAFNGYTDFNALLYVPEESMGQYAAAPVWEEFIHLLPLDESARIESVSVLEQDAIDIIYNLQGVRMNCSRENLPKGIYIINGKKVFVNE